MLYLDELLQIDLASAVIVIKNHSMFYSINSIIFLKQRQNLIENSGGICRDCAQQIPGRFQNELLIGKFLQSRKCLSIVKNKMEQTISGDNVKRKINPGF